MRKIALKYLTADDGAVTVDWVALTAGVITVIALIYYAIEDHTVGLADNIGSYVSTR